MLHKPQPVETLKRKGPKTVPKNNGPLLTVRTDAKRVEHRGRSASTGEEERQPTEYVVERVSDCGFDGRRMLYCVRRYGFGPMTAPESGQSTRYEQRSRMGKKSAIKKTQRAASLQAA